MQVLAATMDGASINRHLIKLHTKGSEFDHKVLNPFSSEERYIHLFLTHPISLKLPEIAGSQRNEYIIIIIHTE